MKTTARTNQDEDKIVSMPEPTLRRMPSYLSYVKFLFNNGRDVVSAPLIANFLKLDSTLVAKDLASIGAIGRPRVGYDILKLIDTIEIAIGWRNVHDAFLIGAGNLGAALMGYNGFQDCGFNIVAAFDSNPQKVGTSIHGKPIFALDRLKDLISRMKIQIGIIATPADQAQKIADLLIEGGIKAIWNFANVQLDVPDEVILQNNSFYTCISIIKTRLSESLNKKSRLGEDDNV